MRNLKSVLLAAALVVASSSVAVAQEARPYTDGPVTQVSMIRTKPGMFDAYMKWIAGDRKKLMEEYKKAGTILDYRVFTTVPRSPDDADIILTVTYKNYAALDGLTDRQDSIVARVVGSNQRANELAISRETMRTQIGSRMIQEAILK